MKMRNIIPVFAALFVLLLVGCKDDDSMAQLGELQVSKSYVSIPVEGGSDTITLTAHSDWKLTKVVTKKDSVKWLEISDTIGTAGQKEIIFKTKEKYEGRTAEVLITCNGQTQHINIVQGLAVPSEATCADVIAGPDSKTYLVTGTVTSIANTQYGNWYLTDKTGTIYIYGTLDKNGAEKNFASLGLEVGDEVTVQGPKTTYGTTVELVNVTVVKINKSLIKVDSVDNAALPLEGGEAVAHVTCKGQGVSVDIPEDAKSWLSIQSIKSSGTSAEVTFKAAPNTGGDRNTTITFHTTDGAKDYTSTTTITQKGAIVKATVKEFLAAEPGDTQYRLSGVVKKIANTKYGNFYIADFSGEVYVYGTADFQARGVKEGDIVTIVGKRARYTKNGVSTEQMTNATLEEVNAVTSGMTIADIMKEADSDTKYYLVTATVTKIENESYGNMDIKDASGECLLYGCYPGYGATGDARKGVVAAQDIKVGDQITVVALKSSHSGKAQLKNGIFISK
jgi:hypothetical protein